MIECTGIIVCDVCEKTTAAKITDADRNGWDWFTGRLEKTFHVCKNCRRDHLKHVFSIMTSAGV